ncbi:4-oxalomesaconate tautomerase [Aurantivibrio infirmus]
MQRSIPCTVMRGGTSKGLYFLAKDLPDDEAIRNEVLLAAMGSPDARQIDGMGGAHPLTSKVAIISESSREDADVDYLFLQVVVDKAQVSDSQNCGNILAGVGPFAIENKLVDVSDSLTQVRIHMVNTGSIAVANVETPNGLVNYEGNAAIDGVPGTSAPIILDFLDVAGSSCGALLPTGNVVDIVNGVEVTCIDNGMPVVILNAKDFDLVGDEQPETIEANNKIKEKVEAIRLVAGVLMGLGDVKGKTVPKMSLVSKAKAGGIINTRTFIPHRVHDAIGVLGAVSVASACVLEGSVANKIINTRFQPGNCQLMVEHPTGFFTVELSFREEKDSVAIERSALLRTARKLMSGDVFIPSGIWNKP